MAPVKRSHTPGAARLLLAGALAALACRTPAPPPPAVAPVVPTALRGAEGPAPAPSGAPRSALEDELLGELGAPPSSATPVSVAPPSAASGAGSYAAPPATSGAGPSVGAPRP